MSLPPARFSRRPKDIPKEGLADALGRVVAEHLADIALHWADLAPYGEAATARTWALRAAEEAVRRLAYERASGSELPGWRGSRWAVGVDLVTGPAAVDTASHVRVEPPWR